MSMMKKALFFGLGALSITREKAEKVFAEMAEKGDITRDEAKKFVDEAIKKGEEEKSELRNMIREEFGEMKKDFSMVARSELEALEARIKDLEQRLQ